MKTSALVGIVAIVVSLLCIPLSCRTIQEGHLGIRLTLGKASNQTLTPGPCLVFPVIQSLVTETIQPQTFEVTTETKSKDTQRITTIIAIQHYLVPDFIYDGYKAIGSLERYDAVVISPAVYEAAKEVTAQYTASELITKREEVKNKIDEAIQKFVDQSLKEKDVLGSLNIINVSIKDFDFSPSFDASIESKVKAEQQAMQALKDKEKLITESEAKAAAVKLAADARAYDLEKMSLQRAAAITREAEAISSNPQLLELRAIETWNGVLPQFMGVGQTVPFINLQK